MKRHGESVLRSLVLLALLALGFSAPVLAQEAAKSTPEAEAMYADAANFQNNSSFELAAEEWEKFLKKYPKDPLAAKAQHYLGVCELQLKHYDKAAVAFAAVVKNYPKFEALEDAYLNLGWSQYSLGQHEPAAATFADMLKAFPKGKFTDQALYFQGESYYQLGKKAEAVAAYSELVKNYEKANLRPDALYAMGVAQEELTQWADAGKTYDTFLKEFESSELATEVRMRKAETVLQTGDAAAAEKAFSEVAASPVCNTVSALRMRTSVASSLLSNSFRKVS